MDDQAPRAQVVEVGAARCVVEPKGLHGLEGYQYGERYLFKKMKDQKGQYFRVYPVANDDYYETVSAVGFAHLFDVIEE